MREEGIIYPIDLEKYSDCTVKMEIVVDATKILHSFSKDMWTKGYAVVELKISQMLEENE